MGVHIEDAFALRDVEAAREVVRAAPFAAIVTADLRCTHMPCLVDEDADGLVVVGHVACADPVAAALTGPVLLVFQAVHGYVSASWYASGDTIPTWNHVTLHVRGTPELLPDALPVLRRTVDHFEARAAEPWSLDCMQDGGRSMAERVVAFRLAAASWHGEAKLSQDKPVEERERIVAGLSAPGPYQHLGLAEAMRRARG